MLMMGGLAMDSFPGRDSKIDSFLTDNSGYLGPVGSFEASKYDTFRHPIDSDKPYGALSYWNRFGGISDPNLCSSCDHPHAIDLP